MKRPPAIHIARPEKLLVAAWTAIILMASPALRAQEAADIYLRISQCDNIKAKVLVNGTLVHTGECFGGLNWVPVCINEALIPEKNKLRFEVTNQQPNEFYGSLTFELIKADADKNVVKRFYSYTIDLKDYDRFQMNIDNLIRKQGWSADSGNGSHTKDLVAAANRRDSLDYFFDKQDRFYLTITAAKHAEYAISVNDQTVLEGKLHINSFQQAYALAYHPYFFLNNFASSAGRAVMRYHVSPQENKEDAFLEVVLYHYPPLFTEPQVLATRRVTCRQGEVREGEFDLTEALSRHGYFDR